MNSNHNSSQSLRVLILGGSGNVGKEVVKAALKKGYKVRSLTRNIQKAPKFAEGEVEWHQGSVLDQDTVNKAVEGQDAVISVLGPKGMGKTTLYSESARLVTNAMKMHGVNKYLAITAGVTSPQMNCLKQSLIKKLLKNLSADCQVMKSVLRDIKDSNIEWTVVQPFPLNSKPLSGKYRVGNDTIQPPLKPVTSKADLADFLVKEAAERKWGNQILTIGM